MRVHFTNLGCKLNQAEVERLAREFRAAGHEVVDALAAADLHVVNSCTVTAEAARDSRRAAGRGRSANPALRTVLTGCYATAAAEEARGLSAVDLLIANDDKDRLLERVHARFPDLAAPVASVAEPPAAAFSTGLGRTRALLKIEDGCSMRCAFCIVPRTRGAQRSLPPDEILAEAQALVRRGARELVVTGVQISAYRAGALRLADLVARLLAASGAPRLRLTSIAPWELDDRLLTLWHDRRLCRHLHLSLQSGSSATLRRMRRPYTAARYAALLARVRRAVPGVAVTTDVLVGFPGETEVEFAESLAFVRAAGFARVHVFPFSARAGTEAAALPDQVPPPARRERVAAMLAAAAEAEHAFAARHLGRIETVLWERPRGGLQRGLTDTYLRVLTRAPDDLRNRFADTELVELAEGGVWGRLVS